MKIYTLIPQFCQGIDPSDRYKTLSALGFFTMVLSLAPPSVAGEGLCWRQNDDNSIFENIDNFDVADDILGSETQEMARAMEQLSLQAGAYCVILKYF